MTALRLVTLRRSRSQARRLEMLRRKDKCLASNNLKPTYSVGALIITPSINNLKYQVPLHKSNHGSAEHYSD
jgi:hypothetical protein